MGVDLAEVINRPRTDSQGRRAESRQISDEAGQERAGGAGCGGSGIPAVPGNRTSALVEIESRTWTGTADWRCQYPP